MTSKQKVDGLISDCCREIVKINRQEQKSIEDVWTEGVLNQVLRRLLAAHRLPPKLQTPKVQTRQLFQD